MHRKLCFKEYTNINALKDFPKRILTYPKDVRHKERMDYLLKTCTFDMTSYLVYAVVVKRKEKSLTGYAYLKIPARKFLQTMSENNRSNPRIYQFGNHRTAQIKEQISVRFPVLDTDEFQPKIEKKMQSVYKFMVKNNADDYFAPIQKLHMTGIAEEKLTKVCSIPYVFNINSE